MGNRPNQPGRLHPPRVTRPYRMVTPVLLQLETLSPNSRLRRCEAAAALTQAGYPIPPGTLANLACRGGGPPFSKWGKNPIYTWGATLAWAKARATPARLSTAEHKAAQGQAIKHKPSLDDLGRDDDPKNAA